MSDVKANSTVLPYLGNPPDQYDQYYMAQLVSAINLLFGSISRGIDLNASSLKLSGLKTQTNGLRQNMVYLKTLASGEKVLTIVFPGDQY